MKNRFVSSTDDNRIDSLLSGAKWGEGTVGSAVSVSYSFPGSTAFWAYTKEANAGYTGLNTIQQARFKDALNSWAEVTKLTFTEVSDSSTYGDIRVAFTRAITGDTLGYAYLPGSGTFVGDIITPSAEAGDVWLNPSMTDMSVGSVGYSTLIHELGHALGFKHSFEAEGGFPAIASEYDSTKYTVMSYTDHTGAGFTFKNLGSGRYTYDEVQPTTPMLYDILAMQHMYGADTTTRTGDDIYTFTQVAELKTIWDAGGTDTVDLSNQSIAATLNLNAGAYSDIGQRQMTYQGPLTQAEDNIAIAFGVQIENAVGTAYNDEIIGNAVDNILNGGAGNDRIDGGEGADTAVFSGKRADYLLSKDSQGNVIVAKGAEQDTLLNVETLAFSDGTFSVTSLLSPSVAVAPTKKSEVEFKPQEGSTAYFLLELANAMTSDASVQYTTRDGSAIAGQDYVATSGVAVIRAGETYVAIAVELIEDGLEENDEVFSLVVFDPEGGVFTNDVVELVAERTIVDNDALV